MFDSKAESPSVRRLRGTCYCIPMDGSEARTVQLSAARWLTSKNRQAEEVQYVHESAHALNLDPAHSCRASGQRPATPRSRTTRKRAPCGASWEWSRPSACG